MPEEEFSITVEAWYMAKKHKRSDFGRRLVELRKSKGITQERLAEKVGLSRRAVAYYETEGSRPPDGTVLLKMARILDVSVDQLLGAKVIRKKRPSPKEARLLNRLQKVQNFSIQDQRAVLKYIDALAKTK